VFSFILDFLFPPQCLGCKKEGIYLCFLCLHNIPKRKTSVVEKDIYGIYSYKEPLIKKSLWCLKFKGIKKIGEVFGKVLYEKALTLIQGEEFVLVIPIPTTRKSFLKRGFNQSDILARALVKENPKQFCVVSNLLKKKYGVKKQTSLKTRNDRIKNMENSYLVSSQNIKEKTILLIDDITTTGATFREAQRVLKQYGAKNVYALAVAYQELN